MQHLAMDLFAEIRPPIASLDDAAAEAERCLLCGGAYAQAPCVGACPVGIDIPGFIGAIARRDVQRAADLILQENSLGGTCARVCPTPVLCAGACVLAHEGLGPVDIALLQRYATDNARVTTKTPARLEAASGRVAVLGAGPAGLACAGELARRGLSVTVIDARPAPGGLARFAIAPYRLDTDPLEEEAQRLRQMGVTLTLGQDIQTLEDLRAIEANFDAIFLGIGLGEDETLEIPGSDLQGVYASLPFIADLKDRRAARVGARVAVIGGGNTAIDVAREALRLGGEEVTIVYRRSQEEMPAYAFEVEEAVAEGIRFEWLAQPVRFLGLARLAAVECRRMRLSDPDDSGRRSPQEVADSEFLLAADTVITALGQRRQPLAALVEGISLEGRRIAVDPKTGQTGNPKYYAGGDAVNGGATVVEAVRTAKIAARAIAARLGGDAS